jgi:hypothetical protein
MVLDLDKVLGLCPLVMGRRVPYVVSQGLLPQPSQLRLPGCETACPGINLLCTIKVPGNGALDD